MFTVRLPDGSLQRGFQREKRCPPRKNRGEDRILNEKPSVRSFQFFEAEMHHRKIMEHININIYIYILNNYGTSTLVCKDDLMMYLG